MEGSPAEKAGLRPTRRDRSGAIQLGDLIVGINNTKIASGNDLILELERYRPGDEVEVTLQRDKEEVKVRAVLEVGS